MKKTLRPQRNVFLLFLGAIFVALMSALPLVVAQNQQPAEEKPAPQAARPPAALDHPGFEQADRNKDGHVDKSEARVIERGRLARGLRRRLLLRGLLVLRHDQR